MRIKLSRVIIQMRMIITTNERKRVSLINTFRQEEYRYTFQSNDLHAQGHVLCCYCSIASHTDQTSNILDEIYDLFF